MKVGHPGRAAPNGVVSSLTRRARPLRSGFAAGADTVRGSIIGLPAKIASVGHPGQQCAGIPFSGSVTLIA